MTMTMMMMNIYWQKNKKNATGNQFGAGTGTQVSFAPGRITRRQATTMMTTGCGWLYSWMASDGVAGLSVGLLDSWGHKVSVMPL